MNTSQRRMRKITNVSSAQHMKRSIVRGKTTEISVPTRPAETGTAATLHGNGEATRIFRALARNVGIEINVDAQCIKLSGKIEEMKPPRRRNAHSQFSST